METSRRNEIETQKKKSNTWALAKAYLKTDLASYQVAITDFIIKKKGFHLLIVASRQVGKSFSLGAAVTLLMLVSPGEKILIIAPTKEQATIIYKHIQNFIAANKIISSMVQLNRKRTVENLDSEISKKRLVFNNGSEVFIMTAGGGNAETALGQSPTTLIIEESGSIEDEAYDKIIAMMASVKEKKPLIVEIGTAHRVNHFSNEWEEGNSTKILITCDDGIIEGRINKEFIGDRRERMTKVDFNRWFMGEFPTQGDDAVINRKKVKESFKREVEVKVNVIEIGVDIARYGDDSCTLYARQGFNVFHRENWEKKDLMHSTGKIKSFADHYYNLGYRIILNVDDDGLGGGVTDRLKEQCDDYLEIHDMHNGNKAFKTEFITDNVTGKTKEIPVYANRITELWFWIGENIDKIKLPENKQLLNEFSSRKYGYASNGSKILETKKQMKKRGLKSPDEADGCVYCFASETRDIIMNGNDAGFM